MNIKKLILLFFTFILWENLFSQNSSDLSSLSLEELMNIKVVTASKFSENIKDVPASVVVITRKDIESLGYKNILEVIENIPGVYLHRDYLKNKIGIRGFMSSQTTAVLLNGVYQNFDISFIPVQSIDRIEVIRGPMSVVYGAGAFLGAINIITNKSDNNSKLQNFFSASYGSNNSSELFGKFRYQDNFIKSSVNLGISHTDGITVPYKELILDKNRLPILGVPEDMTTKNQLCEDKITIEASINWGKFFFNFNYIEVGKGILYFYPSTQEGSVAHKTINYFSLGYKNELYDNLELTAKVDYLRRTKFYEFNFDLSDTSFMSVNDAYFSEGYRESKIIPEVNLLWNINDKFSLNFGIYSQIEKGRDIVDIPFWGPYLTNSDIFFVRKDESVYTNAIYSQFQYKPSEKLFLKLGIRAEEMMPYNVHHDISQGTDSPSSFDAKYNGSGINIIPQFALIYSPNKKNVIKFLYGEAIKNPKIKYIYSDMWAIYKNGVNKAPLTSEKIRTYEINYSSSIFNSKLLPSISVFRNQYSNMIKEQQIFKEKSKQYYWLLNNYAVLATNGIELDLMWKAYHNLRVELSYTYQKTTNLKYKNIAVGNSPKNLAYVKVIYSLNNMIFGINGNYVDAMLAEWNLQSEKREAESVPALFNLGLNFRINNILESPIYLNFHISNLLNSEIRYTSNSQEFTQKGYLFEERNFYLTAGYKF